MQDELGLRMNDFIVDRKVCHNSESDGALKLVNFPLLISSLAAHRSHSKYNHL